MKCAAFMVAVVAFGRPRQDLVERDALNQGGPAMQLRIRSVNSSHLGKPKPRPVEAKSVPQKFDGRVDNDDVVASDREARWNDERRVAGACWCNGLFGVRQARLSSRRHKLGGSDESRIRGR